MAFSIALSELPPVVVVVGADAIGGKRFVNSAGTGGFLTAARHAGVETVLVADSGKDVPEDVVDEIVRLSPIHHETESAMRTGCTRATALRPWTSYSRR